MTTLHISISAETEAKLRESAAAYGLSVDEYAVEVLKHGYPNSYLDRLMAPVRREVAESGMTDDEVDSLILEAIEEVRSEKRPQAE